MYMLNDDPAAFPQEEPVPGRATAVGPEGGLNDVGVRRVPRSPGESVQSLL